MLKRLINKLRPPAPTPEDAYRQFVAADTRATTPLTQRPLISVVTPVYNPPLAIFQATAQAVLDQTYDRWEWCVADASPDSTVWDYLQTLDDPRIRPLRITENKGIAENTNAALRAAQGEYIALLDHDDLLAPHALYVMAQAINTTGADLLYSDEDKLDDDQRCEPFFKPDWSPEMMLCVNLITHLAVFRRSLLDTVGYLDPATDGAQDWDLFLRISEHTQHIHHVPQVLYHWRKVATSTAQSRDNKRDIQAVQRRVVNNHLKRRGLRDPLTTFTDPAENPINAVYPLSTWRQRHPRKISILIRSTGQADHCLRSIFAQTTYPDYEVIVTGRPPQVQDARLRVAEDETAATGELLLDLHEQTEVLHGDWLDVMAQWFEIAGVGMVGAKLLAPNGRILQAGMVVTEGGEAVPLFANAPEHSGSIFGTPGWYRNMSLVSPDCRMRVNSFAARSLIHYRVVYTPHARLIHHGQLTPVRVNQPGDPYFNPNLRYLAGKIVPRRQPS